MSKRTRRTFSKRETIIGALVRRRKLEQRDEISPEADLIREISKTIGVAGKCSFPFEVRIKNGSYTVKSSAAVIGDKVGEQYIPTVTNSMALIKMVRAVYDFLISGDYHRKTETKSVMDGINLYLEGGKSYLVLGAPGSGKSTCK